MKSTIITRYEVVVFFLFLSVSSFAQTDTAIVKFKNSPSVWSPKGYSHASAIDLGNSTHALVRVFTSQFS